MEDFSNRSVLVYDNGLFVELAWRLARDFGKVGYYMPWRSAYPKRRDACVGEGIPGLTRVYNFWDVLDDYDLLIFPDVYDGDLQTYLRAQGKRVWGSGHGEVLELDREDTRRLQSDILVSSPPTKFITGIDSLKSHLLSSNATDKWIKVSTFRGDGETWHHIKPFTSQPYLDHLASTYGPIGQSMEFVVEDNIEGVEIGYDGYTIDGQFPNPSLWGIEVKDLGYLGIVTSYDQLPAPLQEVNSKFAPTLKSYNVRSFLSFEMRVSESRTPVVIDPMMRAGAPGFEVWMELYENLAEILWYGAEGVLIDPKPVAKWAATAMITSEWAVKNWTPISIPAKYRQWVKIRDLTIINGNSYYAPQRYEIPEIGGVVGLGNTMQEAIDMINRIAETVDGFKVVIRQDSLSKAQEAIEQASKYGIKMD